MIGDGAEVIDTMVPLYRLAEDHEVVQASPFPERCPFIPRGGCWWTAVLALVLFLISPKPVTLAATPDFETDVAPLLIKRCLECHQGSPPSGGLDLTTHHSLNRGGDSGPVIDPRHPRQSKLVLKIRDGEMPPEKQSRSQELPESEIQILTEWLEGGAPWPEDRALDFFERTNALRAGRDWWSLQPVVRPEFPSSEASHPIDAFIRTRLEREGLRPAPPADRETLVCRLFHVLTGLPPERAEIEAFVRNDDPQAWPKLVDRLLASPRYGERWARHWLDVARYADTCGYERDQEKPFAWKYRDWVVSAFNADMPYDRFVIHQLAGDEVPESGETSVIATGFLRLGAWNDEPNDPEDYQYERPEELVHTTSSAFLALTVKCARCHAHKFDAITQQDPIPMKNRPYSPCRRSRREFVWQMGNGFAGLALTDLLTRDGFWGGSAVASEGPATETRNPLASRASHFQPKAKACIFLMMNGAPSQVDTFDYKPELEKYAGKQLPADKNYINSGGRKVGYLTPAWRKFRPGGQSGLLVSDYFPLVRRHADKLCVLNACHTDSHAHGSALVAMNTGKTLVGRPSLGSWAVYGLGTGNESLPGYVVILDKRGEPISGQPNWASGFMPGSYSGTLFRPMGDPILDLSGPAHLTHRAQRRLTYFHQGREESLTDVGGRVIHDVLV